MQVDARERGFSYSYDAPLDMRMDPGQELDARTVINELGRAAAGPALPPPGRGAERPPDRPRGHAPARDAPRSRPPPSWWRPSRPRCRPRSGAASAAAIPASACSRPCGSRSTRSSSRSTARSRWPGRCCATVGASRRIAFHSLEDRRVKRFLAERAQGCVCPPDFPICVCGREPEAELLTRRAVAPTPGEVGHNPRAKSGTPAGRPQARRAAAGGGRGLMARSAATAVTRPQPRRSRPQRERPHPARPQRPRSRPAHHGRRAHASRATAAPALPRRLIEAPFARAARARTGGVLDALLAGRGWIVLIGLLLAGIVFFNVDLLQMNRDIAMDTERAAALKRENGRLRLDVAKLASSERIQEAAARLGLVLPAPGEVRYLKARPGLDARRAARRITEPTDLFSVPAPAAAVPPVTAGRPRRARRPRRRSSTRSPATRSTRTPATRSIPQPRHAADHRSGDGQHGRSGHRRADRSGHRRPVDRPPARPRGRHAGRRRHTSDRPGHDRHPHRVVARPRRRPTRPPARARAPGRAPHRPAVRAVPGAARPWPACGPSGSGR